MTEFAAIFAPGTSFTLSGPSMKLDPRHLPVRGDLAHIRLAGNVFVPHYVMPMPHRVNGTGADLRVLGRADADLIERLPTGTLFNVLDLSGGWAWGQVGDDGVVGYLPVDTIHPAE